MTTRHRVRESRWVDGREVSEVTEHPRAFAYWHRLARESWEQCGRPAQLRVVYNDNLRGRLQDDPQYLAYQKLAAEENLTLVVSYIVFP